MILNILATKECALEQTGRICVQFFYKIIWDLQSYLMQSWTKIIKAIILCLNIYSKMKYGMEVYGSCSSTNIENKKQTM